MIGERVYSGSPYEEKAGYARAVVVDGWIFVSGTTGFDPDTKQFPEDVESQCENCFRNISRALAEAGATLDDLVRVLIFVTSQPEFERIMPIIRKHCYAARPANTAVFARLVAPHMNVEIEAMARKRRWLFTGDLYLAPKLRYLRADEDIYAMLDSLRRVSALEPDLVFCQHRGRVEDGTAMLRRKLDFLVQLGERVHDLHAKGLDHDEIASALPGSDLLWRMWTAGHFSKGHFVSAFLRPDVPLHVQTPK